MASVPIPATAATSPVSKWSVLPLAALALTMLVGFTVMGSFGTLQESAKAEMGLSDYALSIITGLSAALPMALFSIPIGIMVDRVHRVRLMLVLAAIWTLGSLLTAFAPSAPVLFAARMMTGIGTTGALTAALSIAADVCRPEQRGRAMLIVNLGKVGGIAAAFALVGALFGMFSKPGFAPFGDMAPWRGIHVALTILALVLMLPVTLLREPARREVLSSVHAPARVIAGELWARRAFLIPLFLGQTSVVMADASANIWAAPVLSRVYGLTPDQFAGWVGAVLLGTGILGAILGGIAADIGQKSGRRGGLLIGAVFAAALGVPAALFPVMPDVTSFAVAFGTLALCGTVTGLIASVALTVLIPNELRGLCIGAFIAFAGIVGFGLAPVLVAFVSDMMGGETHLGTALAAVGTTVSIMSVIAFAFAVRHAPASATAEPI
ncbi:MAG: MFS transporter [Pseudomonadota bacterium]